MESRGWYKTGPVLPTLHSKVTLQYKVYAGRAKMIERKNVRLIAAEGCCDEERPRGRSQEILLRSVNIILDKGARDKVRRCDGPGRCWHFSGI